jgi:hypothetical protein
MRTNKWMKKSFHWVECLVIDENKQVNEKEQQELHLVEWFVIEENK